MHPDLFTIPIIGLEVKTYGFFLMIGFLSAVWLAMRRAERVKASADVVLDLSFLALIFGVGGARVFYVAHYWKTQFAVMPNPLTAALDITGGGLEFLGGFLGAVLAISLYALWKKISVRLYLDILAPGAMWGLAFGRLGCFFNGCCFGALCAVPHTDQPTHAWAVRFPFASPAHNHQWEEREVTAPAELIVTNRLSRQLLPAQLLTMSVEKRERPFRDHDEAKEALRMAKAAGVEPAELDSLERALKQAKKAADEQGVKLQALASAQGFPSRVNPQRRTSVSELQDIAAGLQSHVVHPTQLYSAINAMLLAGLLSACFYVRKRHGMVIGVLFVLYPLPRMMLEMIRVDNPHEFGGLTISQTVGISMLIIGAVYLYILYTKMPERSAAVDRAKI